MATYLVEELIKHLPELFQNNQSHRLLHKAVDILNELLIFCKIEHCDNDKGLLPSDVEMKKEQPDEEEEDMHFQSDVPEYNYLPPAPVKPVIIRVMRTEPAPESDPVLPVLYHCPLCEMNFPNPEDLPNHDKEVHLNDVNDYNCPKCGKTDNREAILQHFAKEHSETKRSGKKLLYCPACDQLFLKRVKLRRHYFDAHNKWLNNRTCLLCLKVFDKERQVRSHEYSEHLNGKFCCRYKNLHKCMKEFTTYEELQQHYPVDHQIQESYTCHICGKCFTKQYRSHFIRHVQKHSMTEKTVECSECDEKFFFEIELKWHMKQHIRGFMCDICDYRGSSAHYLKCHMRTHSDERPFVCNICGLGFKSRENHRNHILTHSEVRKHKCEFCGKAFKAKKNLNEHTKIHTGKFSGYCEICKKGFTQKYNLTLHNLKHHQ